MKKTLKYIWIFIVTVISSLIVFVDRVILSPFVWVDLPGIQEINKFDHEKERLAKRVAIYVILTIIALIAWLIFW